MKACTSGFDITTAVMLNEIRHLAVIRKHDFTVSALTVLLTAPSVPLICFYVLPFIIFLKMCGPDSLLLQQL